LTLRKAKYRIPFYRFLRKVSILWPVLIFVQSKKKKKRGGEKKKKFLRKIKKKKKKKKKKGGGGILAKTFKRN